MFQICNFDNIHKNSENLNFPISADQSTGPKILEYRRWYQSKRMAEFGASVDLWSSIWPSWQIDFYHSLACSKPASTNVEVQIRNPKHILICVRVSRKPEYLRFLGFLDLMKLMRKSRKIWRESKDEKYWKGFRHELISGMRFLISSLIRFPIKRILTNKEGLSKTKMCLI